MFYINDLRTLSPMLAPQLPTRLQAKEQAHISSAWSSHGMQYAAASVHSRSTDQFKELCMHSMDSMHHMLCILNEF